MSSCTIFVEQLCVSFFFKQKTAYEMRISDWSSDVCSADLILTWVEGGVRMFRVDNPHTKPVAFWAWLIREVQSHHPDVDRKSVVSGQSVSVRVDLGGRRIIKKNNMQTHRIR